MYLVGFTAVIYANDNYAFEWKCVEHEGALLSVDIPLYIENNFVVLEFKLIHAKGQIETLVDAIETVHPGPPLATAPSASPSSWSTWVGGIAAPCFRQLCKDDIPWYIEDGDTIMWRVLNATACPQTFTGGLKIGDAGLSNDVRWWADESGKPVRPLSFIERGLKIGTLIGSLRVVDGREWGKFDS